jgi:hypothetical protein
MVGLTNVVDGQLDQWGELISLTNLVDGFFFFFGGASFGAIFGIFVRQTTQMKAQQTALAPGGMKTLNFQLVIGDMVAAKRSCQG